MEVDFLIAGAGLAGLSLAKQLIQFLPQKSIALIDPRTEHKRDHTWCFWNNVHCNIDLPFEKRWHAWKVKYKSKSIVCKSNSYPYQCIFADTYYAHTIKSIKESPRTKMFLGESLEEIRYGANDISAKTNLRELKGQVLFDSRPPDFSNNGFVQDFFGVHIESKQNIFDPECVTLMDFSDDFHSKKPGFHFYYLLPFSEKEALVESVFMGFSRLEITQHQKLINQYLAREFGLIDFAHSYSEWGCIPMHQIACPALNNRHYAIGTRGGLVRPSTGYTFAAIHKFSEQLSRSFSLENLPKAPTIYSYKAKLLDTVLLKYLKAHPHDGPILLSSLFERVEPESLVRFLCDSSSLRDYAEIFAAMPKKFELGLIMAETLI